MKETTASILALECGVDFSLALTGHGQVLGWGYNSYGQIGPDTRSVVKIPSLIAGLENIVKIVSYDQHSVALNADGHVWVWGKNWGMPDRRSPGQGSSSTPIRVRGLESIVSITTGRYQILALRDDGTVWAVGKTNHGPKCSQPCRVPDLDNVIEVSDGLLHSLALRSDGTVWAWGYNKSGQLGIPDTAGNETEVTTPNVIESLDGVTSISAGSYHSLALREDGAVWAWGWNTLGQLGDGTIDSRREPVQVSDISDVVQISGGIEQSLALRADGTVWYWGCIYSKALGGGKDITIESHIPEQVEGLQNTTLITTDDHSLALSSGRIYAWGANTFGQLGDGTTQDRLRPVRVVHPLEEQGADA